MDTYEKKYNEALEDMRVIYPNLKGDAKLAVEHAFPELRESEDERIRKWLADYFGSIKKTVWVHRDITCEQILEWLEKQKELDKMIVVSPEVWDNAISDAFENGKKEGEKQKEQKPISQEDFDTAKHEALWDEQKPAWSEEDEDMLNCCISSIEEAKENRYAYKETDGDTSYDREIAFLKSLRPQPKKELSIEKAIQWLDDTFYFLDNSSGRGRDCEITTHDFDSLEEMYDSFRKAVTVDSQHSWKPSDQDELMKLKYAGTSTKLD